MMMWIGKKMEQKETGKADLVDVVYFIASSFFCIVCQISGQKAVWDLGAEVNFHPPPQGG